MSDWILEPDEVIRNRNIAELNRSYVSFEKYLEVSSETRICEWVGGKIFTLPSANYDHQKIKGLLLTLISLFVESKGLGTVVPSPFVMKLEKQRCGREPNILFVSKERQHLFRKTYLDGAADLAIEIISPESVGRDRGEKFVEYEAAKIREYWLIDPERRQAEFYRLNSDGFYGLAATPEGVFQSEVLPEFFLRVEWLWQKQPPTLAALKELNLI